MKVEELQVYILAKQIAVEIYRITKDFPKEEIYGLTSQIRRAVVSIGSNITEGGYRFGGTEFRHFVSIARGSAGEVKYQLELAEELGFITDKERTKTVINKLEEITAKLGSLHRSLGKD